MNQTTIAPVTIEGTLAERPDAAEMPQATLFFATDTLELFIVVINQATGARTWESTASGAAGGVGLDEIAVGTGTGIAGYTYFTFNPTTHAMTLVGQDTNRFLIADGSTANRFFQLYNDGNFLSVDVVLKAATQRFLLNDSAGVELMNLDQRATVRQLDLLTETAKPAFRVIAKDAQVVVQKFSAPTTVTHAQSPYTMLAHDTIIDVDTSGGAVSIILNSTLPTNQEVMVRDKTGNAGANPITITATAGTVLGPPGTGTVNVNYDYRAWKFDGTNWREGVSP